jgi:hypothetical protein
MKHRFTWRYACSLIAPGRGHCAVEYSPIRLERTMTSSPAKKLAVLLASVVLSVACVAPAFAQAGGGGGGAAGPNSDAAKPTAASKAAATTKAERKAARKEARAKKNAELKQLEAHGYQPSRNDPNYPTDIQNAQKKAGIGAAASQ